LRSEVWWYGEGSQWVPQTYQGQGFDLQIPKRGGWCTARPETEEVFVIFLEVDTRQQRKEKSCQGGEDGKSLRGWERDAEGESREVECGEVHCRSH